MSILFWNVRGINNSSRLRDYLSLVAAHRPSLICLVETKIKEHHSSRITDCIPSGWKSLNNYSADPSGRIWFLWDTKAWDCSSVEISGQHLTVTALNMG